MAFAPRVLASFSGSIISSSERTPFRPTWARKVPCMLPVIRPSRTPSKSAARAGRAIVAARRAAERARVMDSSLGYFEVLRWSAALPPDPDRAPPMAGLAQDQLAPLPGLGGPRADPPALGVAAPERLAAPGLELLEDPPQGMGLPGLGGAELPALQVDPDAPRHQ